MNALDRMAGGPDDNAAQAGHLIAAPLSHGSNPNSNMAGRRREDDMNLAVTGASVRRLTPVECERLQGFPDGWTDIPWAGKPHAPDSRRYAALGDAVTVPVAEWIGRRLLAEHLRHREAA